MTLPALWLKLRWYDDTPIRIDINKCESYQPTNENNANTSISLNAEAYHVKETVDEIDDAISNPQSKLRVIKTGAWT